jgi:phosphohistidine swiveling domain-containing protein
MFHTVDGEPFEVRWTVAETADLLWQWNEDHNPFPFTPMTGAIFGNQAQALAAYEEAGIDPPHLFEHFEIHHGFQYTRQSPYAGEQLARFVAKSRALASKHGGACNVWEGFSLPRVREICAWLQSATSETTAESVSAAFNRGFHLTHVAGPAVFGPLQARLGALLEPHYAPGEAALVIQEIGQGADNSTVEADRGIAELGEIARKESGLRDAILAGGGLEEMRQAPEFAAAFQRYLEEYGWRTETWSPDSPTLRERPEVVLNMVGLALKGELRPDERRSGAKGIREAALQRLRERLAGDPTSLAAVEAIANELEGYVAVREGRARWQLTLAGLTRHAVLPKGEVLAAAGVVDEAGDVFFLLPHEVDGFFRDRSHGGGLRTAVKERKREHAHWLSIRPPKVISTNPDLLLRDDPLRAGTLRGVAASRGLVVAPARVVGDVSDAHQMQAGEVLVCVMTSPPWMPIIGLAAALVTDSGTATSHSAIAAREYGIPAVVGTRDATRLIRTGDVLTVDGGAGTVTISG